MTARIERLLFARRPLVLAAFALVTLAMGWLATGLRVDAGFTKLVPAEHEYMRTFLQYRDEFGGADRVLRRIGRMADGWFANTSRRTAARVGIPPFSPDESGCERLAVIAGAAREAGRDPAKIGVEVRIELAGRTPEGAAQEVDMWRSVSGVTHAQFTTMRAGIADHSQRLNALGRFIEAVRG